MKYFIASILTLFVAAMPLFSQENSWEKLAGRLEAKAERWADQAERQAERMADRLEASADRWEKNLEKNWNRNRNWQVRFGDRTLSIACPEGAYLGVEASNIAEEKAKKLGFTNLYGSYVSKVMENSSAKQAGLQPFDYIYGVDEQRTSDNQDLTAILEDYKPGNEVTLHFIRKGQKQSVKVKLGSFEDLTEQDNDEQSHGFLGVSPSGEEETNEMDGVTVEIVENSTAKEMGLQDGDVITAMNGYPVLDWEDIETAIANTKPGEEAEVVFKRNGKEMNAKKALKSYEDVYPKHDNDDDLAEDSGEAAAWKWEDNNEGWFDDQQEQDDRAFLGIHADLISAEKAKKLGFDNFFGSYVTSVVPNTAADKAGIQPFDYIFGIDEYRVGEEQSLSGILRKFKPGDRATVHFVRKGKKSDVNVTFAKQSEAKKWSRNSCEDPFFGINQMGDEGEGVKISPVANSTASDLGLKPGDVILSINGFKMIDWTDITIAVDMLKPGENINVEFRRNGQTMKSSKPIKSYAETKKCENCDCGENVIALGTTPDFKIRIEPPFRSADKAESKPRMDVSSAKVEVAEVGSQDAGELRAKGLDVTTTNLAVEGLKLSPNPTNGMFKLEFNLPSKGNTVVRVFNESGRAIYEYELGEFSGKFSDEVDISQNGAGSYFLHVSQNGKVFTRKIQLTGK